MSAVVSSASAYGDVSPLTSSVLAPPPSIGDIVVTLVASVTTMTGGPAGAAQRDAFVANEGAYWYDKTAGIAEPNTVTVTPNGAFTTSLMIACLNGVTGFDKISPVAALQGVPGQTSLAISDITPSGSALVIAGVAMTSTTDNSAPAVNNGFTIIGISSGAPLGGAAATTILAYKVVPGGIPVGSTVFSWTNGASNTAGWMAAYHAASVTDVAATYLFERPRRKRHQRRLQRRSDIYGH